MFMRWLNELSEWHVRLLKMFANGHLAKFRLELDDKDWKMNIELKRIGDHIESAYPELSGQTAFYVQIIADLYSNGLIANKFPSKTMLNRLSEHPEITLLADDS